MADFKEGMSTFGGRGGKVNSHGIVQEESDCSRMLYESTFKGVRGDDVIGDVLGGVLESASIYF